MSRFGLRENLTLMDLARYAQAVAATAAQERAALEQAVRRLRHPHRLAAPCAPRRCRAATSRSSRWPRCCSRSRGWSCSTSRRAASTSGAKRDIYFLIQRLAREGRGVIVISSELMELIGLCHRVAVMRGGRLQADAAGRPTDRRGADRPCNRNALSTAPRRAAPGRPLWGRLHGFGPVVGLVLLCIAGTLLNSDFATLDNAMNVLTRTAFIGIIAVGMCFVIISGGIDLSVGSMAALIAGCVILLMNALGRRGWLAGAGGGAGHGLRAGARRGCSAWRTAC